MPAMIAGLLILGLAGLACFLFFSRNADTRAIASVDPDAVAYRQYLLRSKDPGAHEQMAMLLASAKVFAAIGDPDFQAANSSLTPNGRQKLIRLMLDEHMAKQGFGRTYLRSQLVWYVFKLFSDYATRATDPPPFRGICLACGSYLEQQLARTSKADVCSFLKHEPIP